VKIAVVAPSPSPFMIGGAERLWWSFVEHLNTHSPHEAELVKLPSPEHDLASLVASYERFSQLSLAQFDLVVSGKYPAWMVAHPRHAVYMLHRLRGLYDAYDGPAQLSRALGEAPRVAALRAFMARTAGQRSALPEFFGRFRELVAHALPGLTDFPGPFARDVVHWLDRIALAPGAIERYVAISREVAARPDYFPAGADVRVAFPPAPTAPVAATGADYFFTASRLDGPKRLALLVDAMKHARCELPLLIAGEGPQREELEDRAAGDSRIRWVGWQSEAAIASLYAGALAVPFVPYREDYGLVAIEAMHAGKPVITTRDAGGVCELVADGETGLVCEPDPAAIAHAMDRLAQDRGLAARLGRAARERAGAITWDAVMAELIAPAPSRTSASRGARKLVVATTFGVDPPRHGGQSRVYHFYGHLFPDYETTIVSFGPSAGASFAREIAPGLREVRVAKSAEHEARELAIQREVGVPVTDVVMPELYSLTPAYADALARESAGAHALVACHPFLYPALAPLGLPIFYEAQDLEWKLKREVFEGSPTGERLLEVIREVEGSCARAARAIMCVSAADAAELASTYGVDASRIIVVPNGTDCSRIAYANSAERAELKSRMALDAQPFAVFMGSGHWPNIEAVQHVVALAKQARDVVFVVIGSVCEAFHVPARAGNLMFLGEVDDVTRNLMLELADAALNPMLHGSGTNLKMLDFFAAGAPVIATPTGARGTGAVDGRECRVVEIDGFALALREVLDSDAHARDAMTRAARTLVETQFDWTAIARQAAAALTAY
jgi:glycosyltransferase involved in cell wall biosynthesis